MSEKIKKLQKPKILIFLNSPLIKDLYTEEFLKAGFEVKTFFNYLNVANLVVKEKPDILFCDIIMSGMDGYQAIELLKKDNRTKNIPIIIVSNLFQKEDIEKGLSLGAADYYCSAHHTPIEIAGIFKNHLIKTGKFDKEDFKKIENFETTEDIREKSVKKQSKTAYLIPIMLVILFIFIVVGFWVIDINQIKISKFDKGIAQKTIGIVFVIICLCL